MMVVEYITKANDYVRHFAFLSFLYLESALSTYQLALLIVSRNILLCYAGMMNNETKRKQYKPYIALLFLIAFSFTIRKQPKMSELRDYQARCIDITVNSLKKGVYRQLMCLPTGKRLTLNHIKQH